MGYSLLEFIKRLGIFLICAQSLIHFTAGKSYEKYVRLLTGLMVLAQFAVPVRALFLGKENAQISEQVERFQSELAGTLAGADMETEMFRSGSGEDSRGITQALHEEIRSELDEAASDFGYRVDEVRIIEGDEGPPRLDVMVTDRRGDGDGIRIERITVPPVSGGVKEASEQLAEENNDRAFRKDREKLAEAFSLRLGTEQEYISVSFKSSGGVYGEGKGNGTEAGNP